VGLPAGDASRFTVGAQPAEQIATVAKRTSLTKEVHIMDIDISQILRIAPNAKLELTYHDLDMAAFQGIHARRVLVVVDEARGVAAAIWNGAETLITNDESHILAIGNPDDSATYFSQICAPRKSLGFRQPEFYRRGHTVEIW
jgi:hypothetical protein